MRKSFLASVVTLTFLSFVSLLPQVWADDNAGLTVQPMYQLFGGNGSPFRSQTPTGLAPSQLYHAYGFDRLKCSFTGTWGSSGLCGAGQTIAIVDAFDDPVIESDLATFNSQFGLPSCTTANGCFTKATPQGLPRADHGWATEITLDVEWAHAIAPGARILLVESMNNEFNPMNSAVAYAASQPGVHQVSMSFGAPESAFGFGSFPPETSFDHIFQVSGVSFVAASGDGGNPGLYPASSPFVVGVGGTTLQVDSAGNLLNETAWSGSGGEISTVEPEPPYQVSLGVPSNGKRGSPDVSYEADPRTGFSIFDSFGVIGFFDWFTVGGTSAGTPQWSALIAIVNSMRTSPLSSISFGTSTLIYNIGKSAYSANFRDITIGSNGSCGSVCNAGPGYDFVTGLGSPLADSLVPTMAKAKT